jgi:hypothetical protein
MRCRDLTIELDTFLSTDITEPTRKIFRQIQTFAKNTEDEITDIRRNMKVVNVSVTHVAFQHTTITASML